MDRWMALAFNYFTVIHDVDVDILCLSRECDTSFQIYGFSIIIIHICVFGSDDALYTLIIQMSGMCLMIDFWTP